jgi:uncharacterized membrane protein
MYDKQNYIGYSMSSSATRPAVDAATQSADHKHGGRNVRQVRPAHIVETVQATARLHSEHDEQATPLQRLAARITAFVGCPTFLGILSIVVSLWICGNLAAGWLGYKR